MSEEPTKVPGADGETKGLAAASSAIWKETLEALRSLISEVAFQGRLIPSSIAADDIRRQLEQSSWWWNYMADPMLPDSLELSENGKTLVNNFGVDPFTVENLARIMAECQEYPAFIYEMYVRMKQPDCIPIPWLRLPNRTSSLKIEIITAFERPRIHRSRGVLTGKEGNLPSEPFLTGVCPYHFDLRTTDSEIAETFIAFFVGPERRERGIPNPKPNTGRRNRGFSWSPIELFDKERIGLILNSSERSQLSKAKREVSNALDLPVSIPAKSRSKRPT